MISLVLSALAFALAAQAPPQKAPLVFNIEVENVYIDAFVSRGGQPTTGLSAQDFELRDNGVIQQLDLAGFDAQPLLAALAFDVSNSLEGERLAALRSASQALLDTLRPEDEATLFVFSDNVSWLAPPTNDKNAIRLALSELRAGGGSPVMDALYAAVTLPKTRGRSLVVLFTDGIDNLSWLDWRQVQKVSERSNALIHVVSLQENAAPPARGFVGDIRLGVNPSPPITLGFEHVFALRQIAEATGGKYWQTESLDQLKSAFAGIAEAMGKRYVLRYVPEGVARPGWHKLELKLKGKKGEVRTRSGYWVAEPKP